MNKVRSQFGTPKNKEIILPLMSKQGEPYVFVVVTSDQSSNEDASEDGEESLLYEYHQVDENEYDS